MGAAVLRFSRAERVYRLLDLGRVSGIALFFWELYLAVLFARVVWQFAAQLVWPEAGLVAALAPVFARASDSLGPGRIQAHLLLISRRVLQGVLG